LSCLAPPSWELGQFTVLAVASDPVRLWKKFADHVVIQESLRLIIEQELQSSLDWQCKFVYYNPDYSFLYSPSTIIPITSIMSFASVLGNRMGTEPCSGSSNSSRNLRFELSRRYLTILPDASLQDASNTRVSLRLVSSSDPIRQCPTI
jgi:hypothetical protein